MTRANSMSWVRTGCAIGMLVAGFITSESVLSAVGKTPGSFAVSPTGAASYTIPIWAPPGPNGLQPSIALTYNSQSRSSTVGVGWSLSGLSSIYRCNKTYAQDGAPAAVTLFNSLDGFCLDGKRLRLTTGTYGQDGSTYQTEIADFSNITAHASAGSGLGYFTVQGRNGQTFEYGNGGNSEVLASGNTPSAWLLDKVTDGAGNSMVVTYSTATGAAVPSTISWSPTSAGGTSYQYTMTFSYGANVAQGIYSGYVAGTLVTIPYLLNSVAITHGSTTVKNYVLSYQAASNGTGRNRLTQVKECADAGATNCLMPTTMTYRDGVPGLGSPTPLITTSGSQPPSNVFTAFDVNGDGRTDFVWEDSSGWRVMFGTSTGFSAPVSTGITSSEVLIGDVDGTGSDGFLTGGSYYKWNGSSFSAIPSGLSLSGDTPGSYALADLNGDGLPDLIVTGFDKYLYVSLNTSTPGTVSFSSTAMKTIQNPYQTLYYFWHEKKLDFYGSGQQDLIGLLNNSSNNGYYVLHFNGTTFVTTTLFLNTAGNNVLMDIGDFNDDGCTDVLSNSYVVLSSCGQASGQTIPVPSGKFAVASIDWDGDGRRDLLIVNGSTLAVSLSNGSSFTAPIPTNLSSAVGSYIIHNPTGDGLDGIITEPYNGPWTFQYYLHNGAGQPPDLLASITDGYGNSATPTYVSIAQNNYSPNTFNPAFPVQPTTGYRLDKQPLYVVNQVTYSDPSGGNPYQQTFWYYEAWQSLQGRGFGGFRQFQRHDSRTSLWETFGFNGAFPGSFSLSYDLTSHDQLGNQLVDQRTYTYPSVQLDATPHNQRWFVYFDNSWDLAYELGGPRDGQLITTTHTSYTYDNTSGTAKTITKSVTDNDNASPYYNDVWTTTTTNTPSPDTTHWCLSLLTQTRVDYTTTAPGGTAVTRTTGFTPDTAHCRYTQVVTEPGNSSYALTQALAYDGFGNVNSVTVSGAGISPSRVTTTDWGATGQFPVSVRDPVSNALGSSGYRTFKGYDYGLGLQTSEVVQSADGSVNSTPATTWQYDVFGRKTLESLPDGTSTDWMYQDCAAADGCLMGGHAVTLTSHRYNKDGSVQTDGTTYFDSVDRPLVTTQHLFASGAYSRVDRSYDSLGRVRRQSMPCSWNNLFVSCPKITTYLYDGLGRLTQTQRPVSDTDSTLRTETIQYQGRTVTTTDPYGKLTTQVRTVAGTLGVSIDTSTTQSFTYDAFGSLLSVLDFGLGATLFTANYDYGVGPFQRDVTDADLDLSPVAGQHRHFTYDALGEVTSWTDAKGQSFALTYDGLSRPLSRTEKLANGTTDLTTNWTWGASVASHNVSQLSGVSANGYTESFTFDGDARPTTRSVTIPGDATYTYSLAFNSNTGLPDTLTYPVSTASYQLKLQYAYQNGILSKVSDFNAGTVYWQANATNPRGQISQETLGNGIVTNRVFDSVTGLPSSVTSGLNGTATVQNESYLFDEVGNLTQRQNNNVGLSESFYYDSVYRLDHSTLNGTVNLQMHYDGVGNITSRSDVASGATWTYDATHKHAVTQAGSNAYTYTYDANGNAISRNGLGITWTSYNHPLVINNTGSGESMQFAYNQDHERWSAVYTGSAGTETTYFIGDLLEKVVSTGGVVNYRHYIYADGTKVAEYSRATSGNTLYYLREDHQGGIDAILNADGSCYAKESFTAFGARRSACTWSGPPTNGALTKINAVTRHGYTWQTALGNMGLNDMNGRIQDAITGRFLSADPNIPDPSNTQDFNRYSYVRNNPLTYMDPSGFAEDSICIDNPGGGGSGANITPGEVGQAASTGERFCFSPADFPLLSSADSCNGQAGGCETVHVSGSRILSWETQVTFTTQIIFDSMLEQVGFVTGGVSVGGKSQRKPDPCSSAPSLPEGSVDANIQASEAYYRSALVQQGLSSPMTPRFLAPTAGVLNWLYNQVRNKGPWDYKQAGSQFQDAGNFNFGAVGAALNIPDQVLQRGAGWAQQRAGTSLPQWNGPLGSAPYGDDPADQAQINAGIAYYNVCKKKP